MLRIASSFQARHPRFSSSIIRTRMSLLSRQQQLSPIMLIVLFMFFVPPPSSLALPSIFFNLASIDIQPLDDQGSTLRVCTEFHLFNISLGPGTVAVKLQFSPDGPSAASHSANDALCADGVERGGRYRVRIMLVDDRDGSELPVQNPPSGASSMFEMLFGWHSEAAITSPSHGSIIYSNSPQIPIVLCHRTHVPIPHLQPPSHHGGLQLESPFAAFVLSINGRPIDMGVGSSASHSCTTAHAGWGRHVAVLEWFNVVEEWQPWWEEQLQADDASTPQLLASPHVDRKLHACCSAMGSLLAFCSDNFKSRRADFVSADVADCPFVHASGAASVVFSVADSAAPVPPLLQRLLITGKYVDADHVFAAARFSAVDTIVEAAMPIIEALAGNFSRSLNSSRSFIIAAAPPSPTESFFNPCVVKLRDGSFRFTARAHDLSDKFLLTRRRSRTIAGAVAADGRAVNERDLLDGAVLNFTAAGMQNITFASSGNPPPFCSPGEQDARVLAPEDSDGCSTLFLFAPHQLLPSRGGVAAARHCWPLLRSDAAADAASSISASALPQELRFIWLSHSPIEKNWPIWRAAPVSDPSCSSSDTAQTNAASLHSSFLFARTIEPHDIFSVNMQAGAGGIASHVVSTSARALKWIHDNTPFWIHGGSPPVAVPFASSCVGAREACQRHSSSTVMVAVGHAKDAFTFTYVNFLYAFDSSPPHALLGWVPLNLGARVTMGMCLQPLDGGRALLLSYGDSDKSMRLAVYDTSVSLQTMLRL